MAYSPTQGERGNDDDDVITINIIMKGLRLNKIKYVSGIDLDLTKITKRPALLVFKNTID